MFRMVSLYREWNNGPGLCIYHIYTVRSRYLPAMYLNIYYKRHLNFSNAALSFEQIADSYSRWDGAWVTGDLPPRPTILNNQQFYLQHFQTFEHCVCWFALLCSVVYSVVLWENRHQCTIVSYFDNVVNIDISSIFCVNLIYLVYLFLRLSV